MCLLLWRMFLLTKVHIQLGTEETRLNLKNSIFKSLFMNIAVGFISGLYKSFAVVICPVCSEWHL